MYDYSDNHRRLKRNFHYAKCEPRLRARAMTLLRVLASIEGGKSVEQATRQFGIKRQYFYFWIRRYSAFCSRGLHHGRPERKMKMAAPFAESDS
jgi:transposase